MSEFLFWVCLCAYLVGTILYLLYIFIQRKQLSLMGLVFLALGFASQSVYFILEYIEAGQFPIVNFQQSLSFFAWAIVGCYFLFQSKFNLRVLGSFVAPLAVVLVISSSLFPLSSLPYKPTYKSVWLPAHVISVFLGNGMFAVAFVVSVMYLLQEHAIKSKKLGFFFRRLPPLDRLDALNYRCLVIGFPLLSLGMITGSIYAQISLGSYWRWDPMEVWSLITWFMYAAILHQRLTVGWQGRRAAIMSIVAFLILLFTFLVVGTWMRGYHTYALPEGSR